MSSTEWIPLTLKVWPSILPIKSKFRFASILRSLAISFFLRVGTRYSMRVYVCERKRFYISITGTKSGNRHIATDFNYTSRSLY